MAISGEDSDVEETRDCPDSTEPNHAHDHALPNTGKCQRREGVEKVCRTVLSQGLLFLPKRVASGARIRMIHAPVLKHRRQLARG